MHLNQITAFQTMFYIYKTILKLKDYFFDRKFFDRTQLIYWKLKTPKTPYFALLFLSL